MSTTTPTRTTTTIGPGTTGSSNSELLAKPLHGKTRLVVRGATNHYVPPFSRSILMTSRERGIRHIVVSTSMASQALRTYLGRFRQQNDATVEQLHPFQVRPRAAKLLDMLCLVTHSRTARSQLGRRGLARGRIDRQGQADARAADAGPLCPRHCSRPHARRSRQDSRTVPTRPQSQLHNGILLLSLLPATGRRPHPAIGASRSDVPLSE